MKAIGIAIGVMGVGLVIWKAGVIAALGVFLAVWGNNIVRTAESESEHG